MTVRSYGPVVLPVLPASAADVTVTRPDGSVPTFTTPVTVDPTTKAVSFALDDGGAPPIHLIMKVKRAGGGSSTTIRLTLPEPAAPAGPTTIESGLLASRPGNGARSDGSEFYATDDNGGQRYVMVAGAWAKRGPAVGAVGGQELQRAEFALASQVLTAQADVTGMAITFTVVTRPVYVEAFIPVVSNATAGAQSMLQITDNGNTEKARCIGISHAASSPVHLAAYERIATPGTYTRKMRLGNNGGGGNVTLFGTATGAQFVPFLTAYER